MRFITALLNAAAAPFFYSSGWLYLGAVCAVFAVVWTVVGVRRVLGIRRATRSAQ